jgi:DNA-binding FadR family transcriptional regulator
LVLEGELAPGQKIPSERQMCAKFSVSRAAVREALKVLQARQLITTKHGSGSFVADIISQPGPESPFIQLYFDHTRTLYDLYEVRQQLEGQAASLAAQRATQKDLYLIEKAYLKIADNCSDNRVSNDQAFHKAIVEASHNSVLIHVLASLEQLILHSVQASIDNLYHIPELKTQMDKHHLHIFQAVTKGHHKKAENAARKHLLFVSQSIKQFEQKGQNIIRESAQKD